MYRLIIFSCLLLATFARRKQDESGRIVGGVDTDITKVPYQVSVQYAGHHTCGGSIIGDKYVLTAAHCTENKDEEYFSVRAGSNYYLMGGQVVDVASVINHPNYNSKTTNYDIAVLVLEKSLETSNAVKIVPLATSEPTEGDMVLISGWGAMKEDAGAALFLQSVSVPVVSREKCQRRFSRVNTVTNQMFCAGFLRGGKDSCQGDSGGPAVVNGKLAGVVSWGVGCGLRNTPGVYTNVASVRSWITEQTLE